MLFRYNFKFNLIQIKYQNSELFKNAGQPLYLRIILDIANALKSVG